MGWGRMLLLGDIGQQMDLHDQKAELDAMRAELRHSRRSPAETAARLEDLERENDELRLYLAATVRLLVSKGHVTRDEVVQLVEAIDAEDGAADGKFAGPVA